MGSLKKFFKKTWNPDPIFNATVNKDKPTFIHGDTAQQEALAAAQRQAAINAEGERLARLRAEEADARALAQAQKAQAAQRLRGEQVSTYRQQQAAAAAARADARKNVTIQPVPTAAPASGPASFGRLGALQGRTTGKSLLSLLKDAEAAGGGTQTTQG